MVSATHRSNTGAKHKRMTKMEETHTWYQKLTALNVESVACVYLFSFDSHAAACTLIMSMHRCISEELRWSSNVLTCKVEDILWRICWLCQCTSAYIMYMLLSRCVYSVRWTEKHCTPRARVQRKLIGYTYAGVRMQPKRKCFDCIYINISFFFILLILLLLLHSVMSSVAFATWSLSPLPSHMFSSVCFRCGCWSRAYERFSMYLPQKMKQIQIRRANVVPQIPPSPKFNQSVQWR